MCSCPPFECLCRPSMSAFQAPSESMFADPLSSAAAAILHPVDTRAPLLETFDFGLGQTWRETYGEYFDINPDKYQHGLLPPPAHTEHNPYIKSEYSFNVVPSTPLFPEPTYHDLKAAPALTAAQKDLGLQDCMFSSSALPGMDLPSVPVSSMAGSPPSYSQAVSPHSVASSRPGQTTSPVLTQMTSLSPQGHVSPVSIMPVTSVHDTTYTMTSSDVSHRSLDDFEINNPGDILSLDQPINKDLANKYSKRSTDSNGKSSCAGSNANLDLSALLGLPSISSFLGEGEVGDKSHNEHVDRILGLSLKYDGAEPKTTPESLSPSSTMSDQKVPSDSAPLSPCRGPTPPSLIELQPLKTPNALSSPKKFSDIFSPLHRDVPTFSFPDKVSLNPYMDQSITRDHYSGGSYYNLTSPKPTYSNEHTDPVNFYHSDIFHFQSSIAMTRPHNSSQYN